MRVLGAAGLALLLWAAWVVGGEGKATTPKPKTATGAETPKKTAPSKGAETPKKAGTPAGAETDKKGVRLVINQEKASLTYPAEDITVGELTEGTRLQLIEQKKDRTGVDWSLVRVAYGSSWFQGYVRTALTQPDSLADVEVKVASANLQYRWGDEQAPGSARFLLVRVKLDPSDKCPKQLYFDFTDEASADVYMTYGKQGKAMPYGFVHKGPASNDPEYVIANKAQNRRHSLIHKAGEPLLVTYVFLVPGGLQEGAVAALMLKGKAFPFKCKGG